MKTYIYAALMALICVMSMPASASLQDTLNDTFGTMINTTAPGAYEGSRRGVLTGGSIVVRNRISAPAIVAIKAPRVSGGCGGISLFGGSFSFISMDEFIEYARSIMTNSVGYLFQIGIDAICPSCSQAMRNLEAVVSKVNNNLKNSCETAKWAANGIADAMKDNGMSIGENNPMNQSANAFNNAAEAYLEADAKDTSTQEELYKKAPADMKKFIKNNLVYSALKDAQMVDWFMPSASGTAKKEFLEEVQSLIGTVTSDVDEDAPDGQKIKFEYHGSTLSVKDLIGGKERQGDTRVSLLRCPTSDDPDDKCFKVTRVDVDGALYGMKDRVDHLLLGGSGSNPYNLPDTVGIVWKVSNESGVFLDEEKGLISTTKFPIIPIVSDVAGYSSSVEMFSNMISKFVAIDLVSNVVNEVLKSTETAVMNAELGSSNNEYRELAKRIRETKKEIVAWIESQKHEGKSFETLLQNHRLVVNSTHGLITTNFSNTGERAN